MKKFAVFDIDGTLIRWQLYHAVADKLAEAGLLGANALDDLHAARMRWKKREHQNSYREYETFLVLRYERALTQLKTSDFDKMVDEVINEFKDQVYTYTRDLISDLKNRGYVLLAISGSHQELVRAIAEHYGFDDCVGTTYVRNETNFSGAKQVASSNKAKILKKLVDMHRLTMDDSIAVGDSLSDASMLALVSHPIAFNPDQALYQKAIAEGWSIVIERKNVIYKLEPRDGSFVLA